MHAFHDILGFDAQSTEIFFPSLGVDWHGVDQDAVQVK